MTNTPVVIKQDHMISNGVYDALKTLSLVYLPALSALYAALSAIWNLPNPIEVVGTITAIDTFIGVLLSASTASYNKSDAKYDGNMVVEDKIEGGKMVSLNLDGDPELLVNKPSISFKVIGPND